MSEARRIRRLLSKNKDLWDQFYCCSFCRCLVLSEKHREHFAICPGVSR